jgi:hypothetical protein
MLPLIFILGIMLALGQKTHSRRSTSCAKAEEHEPHMKYMLARVALSKALVAGDKTLSTTSLHSPILSVSPPPPLSLPLPTGAKHKNEMVLASKHLRRIKHLLRTAIQGSQAARSARDCIVDRWRADVALLLQVCNNGRSHLLRRALPATLHHIKLRREAQKP